MKIRDEIKNFIEASGEEEVSRILENDNLPVVIKSLLDTVVEDGAADIISSIVAGVLPRANGILLNYKQNKFERNLKVAMQVLIEKQDVIVARIDSLEEEIIDKFRGLYVEWMLDFFENEKQTEKITYATNGYINMMNNGTNDDLMLMFFSTISELTVLDISILKLYHFNNNDSLTSVMDEKNLTFEQVRMIKDKLERNGLLESKNDIQRDVNLDEVVRFSMDLYKEMSSKNPKKIKAPKTKKISSSDSYKITGLGRRYLEIINAL